ncbi:MAG: orotate phosphoribosyltransferase [Candidatus Aenigmarchaeota archaeon]|nr:orotate phosphoribosyltransferase [Candidatus Aenigmarchaeota archaeon]
MDLAARKEIAIGLHRIGAVKFGEFTLKSGMKSPYYITLRLLISHPELLLKVGKMLGEFIESKVANVDRLIGVAYAGIPLATAVSIATGMPSCYTRREVKEYGISNLIEGELKDGENIVIVDDLITDGQSKIEAMERIRNAGVKVNIKGVAVLLDREQGGKDVLAGHGVQLFSVMTITEVAGWLKEEGLVAEDSYRSIIGYTQKYSK